MRIISEFKESRPPKRTKLEVRFGKLIRFCTSVELMSVVSEFPDSFKINAECSLVLCCIENTRGSQQIQICGADYSNRGYCSEVCTKTHAAKSYLLFYKVTDKQPSSQYMKRLIILI